jgi:hypothetical protein
MAQDNEGNLAFSKVLLVAQILVRCEQYLKPVLLGGSQEVTVLQTTPTAFLSFGHVMLNKVTGKTVRCAFVKEYAHQPAAPAGIIGGAALRAANSKTD